ncbi:MAG: DNA polymerase III subunit beta [Patescibacteria group bacterium]
MKLSCTQENLNQGLMIVSHIVGKNNNLPILSNVLIKAENKILNFSTTNLEIGISVTIRGKVEEDGEFSVDAKLLSSYISLLPKDRIDLELNGDNLKISCQKQKTKIKGQNASDFPLIPKITKEKPYILSAKDFKNGISEVVFAAATSEIRPEISGVYIEFIGQNLVLAATDSYRLAEKRIKVLENNRAGESEKFIIPVKTLQEVSRILGIFKDDNVLEESENVEIYLNENQIMFSYNGVDLISRIIEGQYPDYKQIIPEGHTTQVKIDASELMKAVKTSSLFTKSGIYDIKLEINSENKEVIITSSSSQAGENISSVEAEISGESNAIILNYRYLLDGLQNLDSNKALIEVSDSNNPCVIKSEASQDYLYLIMPIKQ